MMMNDVVMADNINLFKKRLDNKFNCISLELSHLGPDIKNNIFTESI